MYTLPTPVKPVAERPTSPMGINALSPSSDAIFATSTKKGAFSPIGSPLAVSPIGTPVTLPMMAGHRGELSHSGNGHPVGVPSVTREFHPSNNPAFLSSSPLASGYKSPIGSLRPTKRITGDVTADGQDRPSWGSMGNLPSFGSHPLYSDEDPRLSAAQDSPTPGPVSALSTLNGTHTMNGTHTANNVDSNGRSEFYRQPLSPKSTTRPLHLSSPASTVPADLEPKQRVTVQTATVQHQSPNHIRPHGGVSSPVPLMKPAPLQRAGSAGGVLMHAPRRPPPSNVTSITSQPNATEHSSWSVSGVNTNTSYKGYEDGSEEWFDQFGGIEMEASASSSVAYAQMSYNAYDGPSTLMEPRTEMSPRIGTRYMPNQRAHFGSPRSSVGYTDGMSPLTSAPTYLQHALGQQQVAHGMSPQSSSPGAGNPILASSTSYSTIKHSSRILIVHNYDQLGTDASILRTLFATHGGTIRSISPLTDSNALLISFFDLRHAQKAMTTLHNKPLPNGTTLEIQYHFLRDTGAMSKESNQGTLVIFNLDPSITNSELMELFGKHGEIKEIRESPNRKHKFVEFYDVRCAEKAIKALNKTDLHGRKIKIEPSRPGGSSKLEPTSAGRRGSLGSTMFGNAPLYTPSALNNHAFTHSTPTLPTMAPGFIGTPTTNPAVPGFASLSPAAAPLLSHNGTSPYHSVSISPRFMEQTGDEGGMFSPRQVDSGYGVVPISSVPGLPLGQSPTSAMGPLYVDRRVVGASEMQNGTNYDEPTLFDRPVLGGSLLSPRAVYMSESALGYSESSTTASLFGEASYTIPSTTTQDGSSQVDSRIIQGVSEGLHGLLTSPTITPRSSTTSPGSSSTDSNGLEAPNGRDDENALLIASSFSIATSSIVPGEPMSTTLRFDIIIPQVLNGFDTRTTLMIKNIPNKYDQDMLLLAVNKHHQGTYDFFYLPIDFKNRCNVGYAFINFIDPKSIPAFHEEFDNKKWEKFNSEKVCRISYARIQGKISMIEHFKNSSLMFEDPKCRPLIFHSDGSSIGKPEPFPVGPNVRPRSRKDSTGSGPTVTAGFSAAVATSSTTSTTLPSTRIHKPRKDKSPSATSSLRLQPEQ